MRKRLFSILLALFMVLSLLPSVVFAQETVGQAATEAELTAALADSANGVVRLTADITITAGLKITRDVTVDLNGHILRYAETANPDSIFRVGAGKLTLTDSHPAATHEDAKLPAGGLITGGKGYRQDGGYGGYHPYIYYGGGVYVETGASFELAGGTIYACGVQSGAYQAFGGGIYADGGSVTMTGGAIRNCVLSTDSSSCGGGVYIYSLTSTASFTMEGGVISGCSAKYGGSILTSGCTVQITGGRIENCKASERGGGLSVRGHADQISVLDAAISGCEAKRGGGVALIGFAELGLGENARITGCKAAEKDDTEAGTIEYGAAVYMDLEATYTVNYPGSFLYANGGRVEGSVYVGGNGYSQHVEFKATNAIDHTDGKPTTVFTGDVYCAGDIRGGSFYGSVTAAIPDNYLDWDITKNFWSNISGGSFYKPVRTEGHVSGGTFYDGLTLEKNANLSGKPMNTGTEINGKTNIPDPAGNPVTVTYDYGEQGGIYAKQIVQAGETAIRPDDPTKTGYIFAGWYLGPDAYDFTGTVRANLTLTAKWTVCDHTGSTAKPTCTDSAVCTACGGTIPENGHALIWQSENGEYWQKCKLCGNETTKKPIPEIVISGADRVCRTQDYIFGFTLPEGCKLITTGYEFERIGGDISATLENGKYTVELGSSSYPAEENGFKVTVSAKTADGFAIKAEKIVTIQNDHTGGKATCKDKAKCEVCGAEYGEIDAKNHTDLKHIPAKAATKTTEGNIEYWYCSGCKKYYKDATATQEIKQADTVTAKLKDDSKSPQTGDSSNFALWLALLFVSGGAAIGTTVVSRKKQYKR